MDKLKRPRKIVYLVLSRTHLLDLAGPAQVFYEANEIGDLNLEFSYLSTGPEVKMEQGMGMTGFQQPDSVSLGKSDFIIIPGIDFAAFKKGEINDEVGKVKSWLAKQLSRGISVATICSGTLIMAEAGLLDGINCTSHWKCIDYLKSTYPAINVRSDQLFVKDRNIYSSAGMTSGMDMSLAILEELYGPILTSKVTREMVLFIRRDKDHSQESIYLDYQTHFNPAIHRVQDYIISHPSKNPTVEELAGIANMSTRSLTRTFKEVTNHTISEFKKEVKAEFAKVLLNNPDYTLESVAERCGYQSARQLRRLWKEKFGTSPSDYRSSNR